MRISERPVEADDPAVPGHGAGDLIIGLDRLAIGSLVERSTRFTMLLHLPHMQGHGGQPRTENGPALAGNGAEAVRDAITATITATITTPPKMLPRSRAWDQGAEMAAGPRSCASTPTCRFPPRTVHGSAARTRTPSWCTLERAGNLRR